MSLSSLFPLKMIIGGSMWPVAVQVSTTVKLHLVAVVPCKIICCLPLLDSVLPGMRSKYRGVSSMFRIVSAGHS